MNGPAPLVTLFVIAYNQESTVREAVGGAFAQTYQPLEILLSDDASPDRTFEIMEEMAAAYDGPHTVRLNRNPQNLGIMAHVNRMMAMASGQLIVAGAGDDVSEPNRVARLAEAWQKGKGRIKAVHSPVREIDADGRAGAIRYPPQRAFDPPNPDPLTIVHYRHNCIGATAAWDREVFDRFGPIPEKNGVEDGPLFFRAALLGDIAFIDAPLVRYRTSGLSAKTPRSLKYDHLYGYAMQYRRWKVINSYSFLKDMKLADFPQKPECIALSQAFIDQNEHRTELAAKSLWGCLTAIPYYLIKSLRTGSWYYFIDSLKYSIAPVYVFYCERLRRTETTE